MKHGDYHKRRVYYMTKVSISVMKANGQTTKVEIENGSAQEVAKAFKELKIDPASITRNGGEFTGELEEDDVVVESKSAKGA